MRQWSLGALSACWGFFRRLLEEFRCNWDSAWRGSGTCMATWRLRKQDTFISNKISMCNLFQQERCPPRRGEQRVGEGSVLARRGLMLNVSPISFTCEFNCEVEGEVEGEVEEEVEGEVEEEVERRG